MSDEPNIANPAPGHLEQAELALDAEDFREPRCGRLDDHEPHKWFGYCDGPYHCKGHTLTEGGWSKCPGCGTSGRPHDVGGVECRDSAREKAISQGDE